MKIFNLLILLLSLLIIGCSSTYRVSDFTSRDKFYNDFNKFVRDKSVKVTLVNDSSFYINNGTAIVNDTLYYLGKDILTGNKKIALSETKEINYTSNDYTPSSIELNNGQIFQAKQIRVNRDSIEFLSMNKVIVLNSITSINKVKKISYKNHFLGSVCFLGIGLCPGMVVGGMYQLISIGFVIPITVPIFIGASSGVIIGAITGGLVGYTYIYQFNP